MNEWDWPPPRRARSSEPAIIEGRIVHQTVRYTQPSNRTGWDHPTVTRFADAFVGTATFALKLAVAIPIAAITAGALWLLVTILSL